MLLEWLPRLVVCCCSIPNYRPTLYCFQLCCQLLCERWWGKQRQALGSLPIRHYFIHPFGNLECSLFLLLVSPWFPLCWKCRARIYQEEQESIPRLDSSYYHCYWCPLCLLHLRLRKLFFSPRFTRLRSRRRNESPRTTKGWLLLWRWWKSTRRDGSRQEMKASWFKAGMNSKFECNIYTVYMFYFNYYIYEIIYLRYN